MSISLARVDDRVIHGQTMTRWVAQKPADCIIVISDAVASDALRTKVLKAAAGNLKFGVFSIRALPPSRRPVPPRSASS